MSSFDKFAIPQSFTGLHGHSNFSVYDGLGYPQDHIEFVLSEKQGMDSWALTDHGNGNGLAHAHVGAQAAKKRGQKYRQLNGVEFYFVPDLDIWKQQHTAHKEEQAANKAAKKRVTLSSDDEQGGLVIEDENATKKGLIGKPEWKKYYHLIVIAKNRKGLENLFTLVKKSYRDGFYRFPRIDFKLLKEHGEGLVVSTACVGGFAAGEIFRQFPDKSFMELGPDLITEPSVLAPIMQRLENMTDRFVDAVGSENFFLELQFNKLGAQHLSNMCLLELAKKTGTPLIATADSHFPNSDAWEARELYKKLGWMGSNLAEETLPTKEELKCLLYPKNAKQMWDEYGEGHAEFDFYKGTETIVKDAIERTHDIAWNLCEDVWIDTSVKLPKHVDKDHPERDEFQQLAAIVKKAIVAEGMADKPEYVARVKEELSDIKFLGHASYFLTMTEIFKVAENRTLMGPGRGSGAGSLVNYLLGITHVDPIPYDLLWARFLGRHRVSWPDIDTDAGDRDELINAAKELYGEEAVVPVSNFNTLKLKSLVKDIGKFYGVPFMEVNDVTNNIQDEVFAKAHDQNQERGVFVLKHEDSMKHSDKYRTFMEKYPDVEKHVATLFQQNKSIGRHAGGVIIGDPKEMSKQMPVIGVRGEMQTPWAEGMNFRHLEDNGILKFDFLGLSLLKNTENCIRRILRKQSGEEPTFLDIKAYFDEHLNCRTNLQDDQEVWKHVYHEGRFVGVFQFTASGAQQFCLQAKPTTLVELAALTAIYRPGPLKANVHKKYVKVRNKVAAGEPIVFDHPSIEKVLKDTYGFIVFQEQFMMLAQEMAGFSPGESDKLRKTLVKISVDSAGGKVGEREIARKKFVEGARNLHDIDEKISNKLWSEIEAFASYGFNKSHAVAYAIDSYYAAWLHTHHEPMWLATLLQTNNDNPAKLEKTIGEIKALGYKFAPADINYSGNEWEYSEEILSFVPPLSSVKGVGKTAMLEIMEARPFTDLNNLLFDLEGKWKHSKMNKTAFTSLCKIEAFNSITEMQDGTIKNHNQLLHIITDDKNYETLKKGEFGLTKTQLKRLLKNDEFPEPLLPELIEKYKNVFDWNRSEKILFFHDITKTVSNALLFPEAMMKRIEDKQVQSIFDIAPGETDVGWCCITEVVERTTKNNKKFFRLKAIDADNNQSWIRVWGKFNQAPEPFTIWVSEIKHDAAWGMSTTAWKMKQIRSFE